MGATIASEHLHLLDGVVVQRDRAAAGDPDERRDQWIERWSVVKITRGRYSGGTITVDRPRGSRARAPIPRDAARGDVGGSRPGRSHPAHQVSYRRYGRR